MDNKNVIVVEETKNYSQITSNSDIYKTSVCPLAKVMRRELKARHIKHLKVVYSKELPIQPKTSDEKTNKRTVPGSTAFVPSSAGLLIASEVIKDLLF